MSSSQTPRRGRGTSATGQRLGVSHVGKERRSATKTSPNVPTVFVVVLCALGIRRSEGHGRSRRISRLRFKLNQRIRATYPLVLTGCRNQPRHIRQLQNAIHSRHTGANPSESNHHRVARF